MDLVARRWIAAALGAFAACVIGSSGLAQDRTLALQEPPIDVRPAVPEVQDAPIVGADEALLAGLFEGALLDAKDGEDFAETPGYRKLLEVVSAFSAEDFSKRVTRDLVHQDCLDHTEQWRGSYVRLRGLVAGLEAVRLDRRIWDHVDVYRGILTEADGSEGVVFDSLEIPPADVELRSAVVDLEGVVYRTVRYENRKGEVKEAPYVIVRNFRLPDTTKERRTTALDSFFGILMALAIVYLLGRAAHIVYRHRAGGPVAQARLGSTSAQLRRTKGPDRGPFRRD